MKEGGDAKKTNEGNRGVTWIKEWKHDGIEKEKNTSRSERKERWREMKELKEDSTQWRIEERDAKSMQRNLSEWMKIWMKHKTKEQRKNKAGWKNEGRNKKKERNLSTKNRHEKN